MSEKPLCKQFLKSLLPIDIVTLGYILITLFYIIVSNSLLENEWIHILLRIMMIILILWLSNTSENFKNRSWKFIRLSYPLILFGFFYSETDYLNNIIFQNLDPYFEKIELSLFGGIHPSVIFLEHFPESWFSEIMNLGYFSYYILIVLLPLWLWMKNKMEAFNAVIFTISTSFYLFYLLFIIFPVAGPQFYLDEPLRSVPNSGLFRSLVQFAEWIGEGPTAAFPSSHVGIAFIMAILANKYEKKLLPIYLFFGLLICFSTVYIKAHYAIDVMGGLFFTPILFWFSNQLYRGLNSRFHSLQ